MRWNVKTSLGLASAVVLLMLWAGTGSVQGAAPADPLVPSPRPTLQPTTPPTTAPTSPPTGVPTNLPAHHHADNDVTVVPPGHVTGTVINQTNGAPVAGVSVNVGGYIVQTDSNGNYDKWLPAGTYNVTLAIDPQQGVPAQDTRSVEIIPASATILHLGLRRNQSIQAATDATSSVPTPSPTPPIPRRLPLTAEPVETPLTPWLLAGCILFALGAILAFVPIRYMPGLREVATPSEADRSLLAALLASRIPNPTGGPADRLLLERLLFRQPADHALLERLLLGRTGRTKHQDQ